MTLLDVEEKQIQNLSPEALTALLRRLLVLEARLAGVPVRQVGGTVNINIGDGGLDCSIDWDLDPGHPTTRPRWLPSNVVAFQVKRGKCQPKKWESELFQKPTKGKPRKTPKLKPAILANLKRGGAYVGFTNEPLNEKLRNDRITSIRKSLKAARSGVSEAVVKMYGSAEIAEWTNEHISAITFVHHTTGNSNLASLQTWEEWENESDLRLPYHQDTGRETIRKKLEDRLFTPKYSARIVGLSGLGKTRMALELCRSHAESVAYIPRGASVIDASSLFRAFVRDGRTGVIVVDECPLELHNQLQQIVSGQESKLSVLTLDFDPSSVPRSGDCFQISPLTYLAARELIDQMGKKLEPAQAHKLALWSRGFPEMARLLLDAVKSNRAIWNLGDRELFERITSSRSPLSEEQRTCLLALSAIGMIYGEDKSDILALFAQELCETRPASARRTLLALSKRQIVESRDEHFFVTPLPLALSLAADWWSMNGSTARSILTHNKYKGLWHALAGQMLYLNKHDNVRAEVSYALMSADKSLRELWFSSTGHRLLQCFAAINPNGTYRLVQDRMRDLEWPACLHQNDASTMTAVLRRLAWHPLHFKFAANRLLEIAASGEKDAKNYFVHLFALYSSGTSIPAQNRVSVLADAIKTGQGLSVEIVIDALICALRGKVANDPHIDDWDLEQARDWQPKSWPEIHGYWATCADIMLGLLGHQRFTAKIQREFAMLSRGLISQGALRFVEETVARYKHLVSGVWVDLRNALASILLWKALPADLTPRIQALRDTLAPTDLAQQVHETVTRENSDTQLESTGGFITLAEEKAYLLGQNVGNDAEKLESVLDSVLTGHQRAAQEFGHGVASVLPDIKALITKSVERVRRLPEGNLSFVLGLLRETKHSAVVDAFVRTAPDDPLLTIHLPRIVVLAGSKPEHVILLQKQVAEKKVGVDHDSKFLIMLSLFRSDHQLVIDFFDVILKTDGIGLILDILFGFRCNRRPIEPFGPHIRSISSLDGVIEEAISQQDHIVEIFAALVKSELASAPGADADAFAALIINQLGDAWEKSTKRSADEYSTMRMNGESLVSVILGWNLNRGGELLFALLNRNSPRVWRRLIRTCRNTYLKTGPDPESVFDRYQNAFLTWAEADVERGLALAKSAALVDFRHSRGWSAIALFLLDRFGQDQRILQALAHTRSHRSWSGSAIPIYSNDLVSYRSLFEHKLADVRSWAEQRVAELEHELSYIRQQEASLETPWRL